MQKRFKLLALAAAVMVTALFGASAAQASTGFASTQRVIGASGILDLNGTLTCEVLLQLTLNSLTISKTTGVTQGTASGGYIRNCRGALAGNPNTGAILGPINVQYRSFTGPLPNGISSISILAPNAAFSVNTIVGNCLYGGSLDGVRILRNTATGAASGVDFTGSNRLPRRAGSFLCPTEGQIIGQLTTILAPVPTITLV